jgi:hypothetical protein
VTASLLDIPTRGPAKPSSPAPSRDERLTLEERLERAWRGLRRYGEAKCPICGGGMTLHGGAGDCRACGGRLT